MLGGFSEGGRGAVEAAVDEARRFGHDYVGTEHLLLGLLADEHGLPRRILDRFGVDRDRAEREVLRILGNGPPSRPDPDALEAIGIDLDAVRRRIEEAFGPGALERARSARAVRRGRRSRPRCTRPRDPGSLLLTPRTKKVLELAAREARSLGHERVGPAHVLLGIVREGEGLAAAVLAQLGAPLSTLRARVLEELTGPTGSA